MNPLKYIMGTDEASKVWGFSPDHIKRMCRDGKIKAKRIGKTWVIDKTQPNPKGGIRMIDVKELLQESMVNVEHVYIPVVGKCYVGQTFYSEHKDVIPSVVKTSAKVLNWERKVDNDKRYDVGNLYLTIDFKNETVSGEYQKHWIGGEIESFNFSHHIQHVSGKRDEHDIYEIDIAVS